MGGGALLLAAALLLGMRFLAAPGARAVVVTPQGETILPLSQNGTFAFEGRDGLSVTLRVEDGRIRFEESGCPDKVCVHTGWLSRSGQTAACLPAGVILRVEGDTGDEDADVDIVAG